MTPTI